MLNVKSGPCVNYNKSFAIGIVLNTSYVAIEVIYGLAINSSALLADAGHNASDVMSLILAWIAICMSKIKPLGKFTYGFRKTTILSSVINSFLILIAATFILWETIKKIGHPAEIQTNILMVVSCIGVLINIGTAFFFLKGKKKDINIQGTFLHMMADAAVSMGVLAGGFLMKYTHAYWIDPLLSLLIVVVILWSASGLLLDSLRLSMDAVPKAIDIKRVKSFLEEYQGVRNVHELHVWALSTTETALTAHLVVPEGYDETFIFNIRDELSERFQIDYSTLQIESSVNPDNYQYYQI